jgi:hypothetical protein
VKFINTDGMAFIGPGSEWFWTAVSGLVLAVTFIAIYRQLRLQRGAEAIRSMTEIGREWDEERLVRARLEVLLALKAGEDVAELSGTSHIADFWERVGYLARVRHIDRMLVAYGIGEAAIVWWIHLKPSIVAVRERFGEPKYYEDFEWLASTVAVLQRQAGGASIIDDALVKGRLDRTIARHRDELRQREELRAVIVRPMSPVAAPEIVPD